MDRKRVPARQRFWPKVARADGCWEWQGAKQANGYGYFRDDSRNIYAHRFAYIDTHGPLPPGTEIDHLCRNRGCVNPAHLEAVTRSENQRRGLNGTLRPPQTHCKHGHALTPENTVSTSTGRRNCRLCSNRCKRESRHRQEAQRRSTTSHDATGDVTLRHIPVSEAMEHVAAGRRDPQRVRHAAPQPGGGERLAAQARGAVGDGPRGGARAHNEGRTRANGYAQD